MRNYSHYLRTLQALWWSNLSRTRDFDENTQYCLLSEAIKKPKLGTEDENRRTWDISWGMNRQDVPI